MSTLLLLLLAASPLEEAQAHLDAGKLDDVLFALEGKALSAAEKPKAAKLLGEAAKKALPADDILALQFAQMALKHDQAQPLALEAGARASRKQENFEAAEGYADKWVKAEPKSGAARLLRAELAMDAAEWKLALTHLDAVKLKGADADAAAAIRSRARKELDEKKAALSTFASFEQQMAEAARKARSDTRSAGFARPSSTGVVIYTTEWCGYCKKAKAFLTRKGVAFTEKDVEKDEGARDEVAQKCVAAGVKPRGVPIIDVRGKILVGFDEGQLAAAL